MKKVLIVAAVLSTLGSSAFAAGAFDGPYVELGLGAANKQTKVDMVIPMKEVNASEKTKASENTLFGQAAAGYSQSLDQNFNIAANLFTQFGSKSAGKFNTGLNAATGSIKTSGEIKLKNIFGISIEPGFYIADKTLAYTKLGAARATASLGSEYTANAENSITESGKFSKSGTAYGFLYGVGVKHLITQNIYVGLEVQKIDFRLKNEKSQKFSQFAGAVTLGYKF